MAPVTLCRSNLEVAVGDLPLPLSDVKVTDPGKHLLQMMSDVGASDPPHQG